MTPSGFSLAGCSQFLACTGGQLAVAICTVENAKAIGPDLSAYSAQALVEACADWANFILNPGQGCWIPFGYMPCIVGIAKGTDADGRKKQKKASSPKQYSSFAVIPSLDANDNKHPRDSIVRMLADLLRSEPWWPKSLKESTRFLKWRSCLEEAKKPIEEK